MMAVKSLRQVFVDIYRGLSAISPGPGGWLEQRFRYFDMLIPVENICKTDGRLRLVSCHVLSSLGVEL